MKLPQRVSPGHFLLGLVDVSYDLLHDAGVALRHRLDQQLLQQLLHLVRVAGNRVDGVHLGRAGFLDGGRLVLLSLAGTEEANERFLYPTPALQLFWVTRVRKRTRDTRYFFPTPTFLL